MTTIACKVKVFGGLIIALDHARHGQAEAGGHWTEKVLRITLAWVESGLGRKSRLCEVEGNLGQRRRTRVLPPKLEGPERRYKWSLWLDVEHPHTTNKIAVELAWHERQLSVCR